MEKTNAAPPPRSLSAFLSPLQSLPGIESESLGCFSLGAAAYSLPRFLFRGPNSTDPIRIGLFAAIHGDEPAGALAAATLLKELSRNPELAENFHLSV